MRDARLEVLRALGGLEDEPEDVVRALAERFRRRHAAAGDVICAFGDVARGLWVTLDGEIGTWRPGPEGDVRVATIPPGRLFGHVALYTRGLRSVTCRADGDAALLEMDLEAAEAVLTEPGPVGRAFRRMLAHALLRQAHLVDATFLRMAVEAGRPSEVS